MPALLLKELDWLRSLTSLPLVLKGVRTAEDAHVAVECGVNGILVSTHGGRQMDSTLSAIESLPEIVEVCKGHAEVYLDSGVRRGSDVLKALALGARAVGVGRPLYWGLAVNGAEGVHGMLELLLSELDQVLGQRVLLRVKGVVVCFGNSPVEVVDALRRQSSEIAKTRLVPIETRGAIELLLRQVHQPALSLRQTR